METRTTLSADLQTAGTDAEYDAAVKKLLANKLILAWLLKSCVAEFRNMEVKMIAEQCIEGEPEISRIPVLPDETNRASKISGTGVEDVTMTEGTVTYDIRFIAAVPNDDAAIYLIINLEAQNDYYPGYPLVKRAIYYCSRMISIIPVWSRVHEIPLRKSPEGIFHLHLPSPTEEP